MKHILIALVLLTGALEYVSCKKNIHVRIAGFPISHLSPMQEKILSSFCQWIG
ncbi:MAG: hypothetical protein ACXWV2_10270 [Chitinophagaceae bacterium]